MANHGTTQGAEDPAPGPTGLLQALRLLITVSACRELVVLGSPPDEANPEGWCLGLAGAMPGSGQVRWFQGQGATEAKDPGCRWRHLPLPDPDHAQSALDRLPGASLDMLVMFRGAAPQDCAGEAARVLRPRGLWVADNRFAFPPAGSHPAGPHPADPAPPAGQDPLWVAAPAGFCPGFQVAARAPHAAPTTGT